jgi:hypothetical protein
LIVANSWNDRQGRRQMGWGYKLQLIVCSLPPIVLVSQYNHMDPCCARLCSDFRVLWTWH